MKALVVYGGWDGHERQGGEDFREVVDCPRRDHAGIRNTLDVLLDAGRRERGRDRHAMDVRQDDAGAVEGPQRSGSRRDRRGGRAWRSGDAFREDLEFQWMIGGQFVGHPHVGEYEVRLTPHPSHITAALPQSFRYNSEQYYPARRSGQRGAGRRPL